MATSNGILQAFELHHLFATDSVVLLRSWVFCVLNHECAKHLHYFSTGTCGHNPCVYTFLHTTTESFTLWDLKSVMPLRHVTGSLYRFSTDNSIHVLKGIF